MIEIKICLKNDLNYYREECDELNITNMVQKDDKIITFKENKLNLFKDKKLYKSINIDHIRFLYIKSKKE